MSEILIIMQPTDYIQWDVVSDMSQPLWNNSMDLAPFAPGDTSLTHATYQQSLFHNQNQFELPSFLGTLSS